MNDIVRNPAFMNPVERLDDPTFLRFAYEGDISIAYFRYHESVTYVWVKRKPTENDNRPEARKWLKDRMREYLTTGTTISEKHGKLEQQIVADLFSYAVENMLSDSVAFNIGSGLGFMDLKHRTISLLLVKRLEGSI